MGSETVTDRERLKWWVLTNGSDVRLHGDDRNLRGDRMVTVGTADPSVAQLLALALLPPEMHPNAKTDDGRRDQGRRYDNSRQLGCNNKTVMI